jgi:hypothetical protein
MEASCAPSMRANVTRLPPESTTEPAPAQRIPRLIAGNPIQLQLADGKPPQVRTDDVVAAALPLDVDAAHPLLKPAAS